MQRQWGHPDGRSRVDVAGLDVGLDEARTGLEERRGERLGQVVGHRPGHHQHVRDADGGHLRV